jgi:KUP system potassium uptake protein
VLDLLLDSQPSRPSDIGMEPLLTTISSDTHAHPETPHSRHATFGTLLLGCIGVVYGDIGTSPLYALREALHHSAADGLAESEVIGVVSLLIWTLTLIVTLKYVVLIMQADNEGEGGTLSLLALAQKAMGRRNFLLAIGVFGGALFYGDAVITPAMSVMSAVEGMKLAVPSSQPWVLPITTAILTAIFLIQSRGTGRIAKFFGPFTLFWFFVMGLLGAMHIGDRPDILTAFDPRSAISFIWEHGVVALVVLGSVFLAVTGAEALYADMGHFGRKPIRTAWFLVVFPALTLNYLGQGALILADPSALENPFYLLAPSWLLIPLVVLATIATCIACQAVITGAFSVTQQAIQLGLIPRLEIRHTSEKQFGQIYVPVINAMLYVGVIALVWSFGSSASLANAYGIAVTGDMVVTSVLAVIVFTTVWKWPIWRVAAIMVPLMALELVFLGSNLLKFFAGGYVPIAIAGLIGILMWTWIRGTRIVTAKAHRDAIGLGSMCEMIGNAHPMTMRGTAVYLTSDPSTAPSALMHNLKHNGVLHERNIVLTVRFRDTPRVPVEERLTIEPLMGSFTKIEMTFGYMEEPNIPKALAYAKKKGLKFEIMSTTFFLSRRSFRATAVSGMPAWQDRLFIAMSSASADASGFYHLPTNRVVEMGQQFTI